MERSDWSDEEPFGFHPPLPPDDRIWRHPSELGAVGRSAVGSSFVAPSRRTHASRRRLAVAVVVSATGALLVAGLVSTAFSTGGRTDTAVLRSSATSFGFAATTLPAVPGLGRPADGVVHLIAITDAGQRIGNGVVLDDRGTIVTTLAAVEGARQIVALLADGSQLEAVLLGTDDDAGAAVLSIPGRPLAAASGWAVTLSAGAAVHTGGYGGTSATVETLGANATSGDGRPLSHLVRLTVVDDWAITEGAPLLDDHERVVGLCTFDRDGKVYAVPIEIARAAARSIAVHGEVVVPWLGLSGHDDSAESGGAVVQAVAPDSPASGAGMAAGDVVVEMDGERLPSMAALALGLRDYDAGAMVDLTYLRGGATHHVSVVLAKRPSAS